jgi:hypothetical protein
MSTRRARTVTIYDYLGSVGIDEILPFAFIGPPDLEEALLVVPAKRGVCSRCDGEGVHDHLAFSNGLTSEDFAGDPDFREEYLRGTYDVRCSECNGKRVVDAPDWDRMTERQRELAGAHWDALAEDAAMAAAERRAGC